MAGAAYRDVLVRISEAEMQDRDGRWHGVDHLAAGLTRMTEVFAEAARLAPPEFAGVVMHHRAHHSMLVFDA